MEKIVMLCSKFHQRSNRIFDVLLDDDETQVEYENSFASKMILNCLSLSLACYISHAFPPRSWVDCAPNRLWETLQIYKFNWFIITI